MLFDTSVLVPAFLEELKNHPTSHAAWISAGPSVVAAHSLSEFYSTTTGMPQPLRSSPEDVLRFIRDCLKRRTVVALTTEEYAAAIEDFAASGQIGGLIYDFLIARCALKVQADAICTWNVRNFRGLGPEIAAKVKTPGELLDE